MRGRRGWAAAVACAAAASVAGCDAWQCDLYSHGACVEFASPPPDLAAAQARMDRLLDLELPYWGLSSLQGWRIQYRASPDYPCYLLDKNDGCTDYVKQTLSMRVPVDVPGCFEAAELLHELGHYALGDPMHSNPHWAGVEAQFARIVWDRADAPRECVARYKGILSGVWRVHRDSF